MKVGIQLHQKLLQSKLPKGASGICDVAEPDVVLLFGVCRLKGAVLLDCFCGYGGNIIQFALEQPGSVVIGCDIVSDHVQMARYPSDETKSVVCFWNHYATLLVTDTMRESMVSKIELSWCVAMLSTCCQH